jgi:hypothetical protein
MKSEEIFQNIDSNFCAQSGRRRNLSCLLAVYDGSHVVLLVSAFFTRLRAVTAMRLSAVIQGLPEVQYDQRTDVQKKSSRSVQFDARDKQ